MAITDNLKPELLKHVAKLFADHIYQSLDLPRQILVAMLNKFCNSSAELKRGYNFIWHW